MNLFCLAFVCNYCCDYVCYRCSHWPLEPLGRDCFWHLGSWAWFSWLQDQTLRLSTEEFLQRFACASFYMLGPAVSLAMARSPLSPLHGICRLPDPAQGKSRCDWPVSPLLSHGAGSEMVLQLHPPQHASRAEPVKGEGSCLWRNKH